MNRTGRVALIIFLMGSITLSGSESETSQEAVPELAGAERVTGSTLVDGQLPSPYVDYIVDIAPGHSQKLSIFANGLVTLTVRFGDRRSLQRVLFPPSAIDTYREYLSAEALGEIEEQSLEATPTRLRETIRIYDLNGAVEEREYDPSLYLPSGLEEMRALLQDIARIIIDDNEITNPLVDYEPQSGDLLLDQQMEEWVILTVEGDNIEVKEEDGPLRAWIKKNQLDEQFVSWTRPALPTE